MPSTISSRTAASTITVASDGLSQRTSTINCGYDCGKGSRSRAWPAPQVDGIEAVAAKYAEAWPAWGHRKIVALMRADGHVVSTSTVERALRQRALLLPRRVPGRSQVVGGDPSPRLPRPTHQRNRVWQNTY